MTGSLTLSNGVTVYIRPDGDHLYADYYWEGSHHRHDCQSVEAERGKPARLVLVTGRAHVICAPTAYNAHWGATPPTVDRIVCGNDHGGHVADGVWFTTDWKRHVGNEA